MNILIHKKSIQTNRKRTKTLIDKWQKIKRYFTEEKAQTANKHLGKYSTSLITKEVQNKIYPLSD